MFLSVIQADAQISRFKDPEINFQLDLSLPTEMNIDNAPSIISKSVMAISPEVSFCGDLNFWFIVSTKVKLRDDAVVSGSMK